MYAYFALTLIEALLCIYYNIGLIAFNGLPLLVYFDLIFDVKATILFNPKSMLAYLSLSSFNV